MVLALSLWLSLVFFKNGFWADEQTHSRQINRFVKGQYELLSDLTTFPGYHVAIAAVAKLFGHPASYGLRLISLAFSLFSIWIFYILARKLGTENPYLKTLQYVFLPVGFIYFPLVYTDIFALLLILSAFYLALSKRFTWSAILSLAAVLVRQNDIIWAGFIWCYIYVLEYDYVFSKQKMIEHIRRTAGYVLLFVSFVIFVLANHGVAIGDRESHKMGFYPGNIYFFLFTVAILFMPLIIYQIIRIKNNHFEKVAYWSGAAGLSAAGAFLAFPPAVHMYNLKLRFLRNIILHNAYNGYSWIYATAIFLGAAILAFFKLDKRSILVLPFTFLALVPSFLVEQRYAIVPLTLLLLFRREVSVKLDYALVLYFFLLSTGLVFMLLKLDIFF